MNTAQITRKDLQDAIARAIYDTPGLTPAEQDALTHVANTSKRVARGDYFLECGCPATQAGLVSLDDEGSISQPVDDFAFYFDTLTAHFRDPKWSRSPDFLEVTE
jgi:hypothetical protein